MKYTPFNKTADMFSWIKNHARSLSVIVAASFAMIAPCAADSYATLSRAGDSITLEKGETALVFSISGVITYAQDGKQPAYLRFSQNEDRTSTLRETTSSTLPLVGPAKITIRSRDGFCGMRIVYTGLRAAEKRSLIVTAPPVKGAKLK